MLVMTLFYRVVSLARWMVGEELGGAGLQEDQGLYYIKRKFVVYRCGVLMAGAG